MLPLDFNHYRITLESCYSLPSAPNDPTVTQLVSYNLNSSDSSLDAIVMFRNGVVHECDLRVLSGSVVYAGPYENMTAATSYILSGIENYTELDTSSFVKTLNMLGSRTHVTYGNLNLSIGAFKLSYAADAKIFHWSYSWNGTHTGLSIQFDKGVFYRLINSLALHTIGNTNVNITRDQAIDIASNYLSSQVFTQASTNHTASFSGIQTLEEANLTYALINYDKVVPCWLILYNLGASSSDGYISVAILADSGQVLCVHENGGSLNVVASNSAETELSSQSVPQSTALQPVGIPSTTSNHPSNEPTNPLLTIAIATFAAVLVITSLLFYRKHQRTT